MQASYDRRCPACRRRRPAIYGVDAWLQIVKIRCEFTSILVIFLGSCVSFFSHNLIWHANSTQHSSAVGIVLCLPRMLKMANLLNFQASYVRQFIERVHSHPILCDSRDDRVQISREKTIVWEGIAAQCDCDWCKYIVFIHLSNAGRNVTFTNYTLDLSSPSVVPQCPHSVRYIGRWELPSMVIIIGNCFCICTGHQAVYLLGVFINYYQNECFPASTPHVWAYSM